MIHPIPHCKTTPSPGLPVGCQDTFQASDRGDGATRARESLWSPGGEESFVMWFFNRIWGCIKTNLKLYLGGWTSMNTSYLWGSLGYQGWVWINTYENTIVSGMNIHFNPAILMWTEGVLLVLTHCHVVKAEYGWYQPKYGWFMALLHQHSCG